MTWQKDTARKNGNPAIYTCLSTDTKVTANVYADDICREIDTSNKFEFDGDSWVQTGSSGAAHTMDGFKPSQYDADLTMNGTAQAVALASGVSLGAGRIHVVNRGATTEAIRIAFGTSAANAQANLTISAAAATTGFYLPAIADAEGSIILGVPANATHYAVANAVASDVQVVSITQGI